MSAVVSIVGRKNSGKTTLIEKLIPLLKERGFCVGTIKHDAHRFEIDHEGTDSYRHKHAGAVATAILSEQTIALVRDHQPALDADRIIDLLGNPQIVITEGFKDLAFPKIEAVRAETGQPPLGDSLTGTFGFYSPDLQEASAPIFRPGQEAPLVDAILDRLGLPQTA